MISFSAASVFSFIGAYLSFMYAIILLIKNERHVSDTYLSIFMMDLTLFMIAVGFKLDSWDICLSFLHCVFLLFYIESITRNFKFKPKYLLHFIPFVLVFLLNIFFPIYFNDYELIIMILLTLQSLIYFIVLGAHLRKYRKYVKKNYSNHYQANINWLYFLTIDIAIMFIIGQLSYFAHVYIGTDMRNVVYIFFLFLSLNVMGLKAIKMDIVFIKKNVPLINDTGENNCKNEPYTNSGLKQDGATVLADKLKSYMEETMVYKNANLNLKDLAAALDTYPHYITQVLNTVYNQNFYDFVNTYRVEEAKQMLKNPIDANNSILNIFLDCGFNSKSSFNRIFKQKTGKTPTEYRAELKTEVL